MKTLMVKIISILFLIIFLVDTCCYGLAIPSAFQDPEAKKIILAALETAKALKDRKELQKTAARASNPKPKIQSHDVTDRLTELFREEKFEGSILGEAVNIITLVLEEERISIPHEEKVR